MSGGGFYDPWVWLLGLYTNSGPGISPTHTLMKKIIFFSISIMVVTTFLLILSQSIYAQPLLPALFYGTIKVDGVALLDGFTISARINGVEYATATTKEGKYSAVIPGDIHDTPEKEGGRGGDSVSFFVKGYRSNLWMKAPQKGTFKHGELIKLDLSLTDKVPPVVTIDPVPSPVYIPTQKLKGTFEEAFIYEIVIKRGEVAIARADLPIDGKWEATVTLILGTNELTVEATDLSGNKGTAGITIVLLAPPLPPPPPPPPVKMPWWIALIVVVIALAFYIWRRPIARGR